MGILDEKTQKGFETVADAILKRSERWSVGQKIAAGVICLLAGAALVSGKESLRVAAGASIALFGVAFLTFHRRQLDAEMLILNDKRGKPRIAMSGEYGIFMFNESMSLEVSIGLSERGPAILFQRQNSRAVIGVLNEVGPILDLATASGTRTDHSALTATKIELGSPTGNKAFLLSGGGGDTVIGLGDPTQIADKGIYLRLSDALASFHVGHGDGQSVNVIAHQEGNVGLVFRDSNGSNPIVLGDSHLSFFGASGDLIERYPGKERVA